MKNILSSIYLISVLSLKEATRKRIVFVILIISTLFLFLNLYCESMVIQSGGEEIKNSSIGVSFLFIMIVFWNTLLSLLITSSVISDEIENKTYIMILSKPIYRLCYLAGKFGGVLFLCTVNALIIIGIYSIINKMKTGIWNTEIWLSVLSMVPASIFLISLVGGIALLINRTTSLLINFFLIVLTLFIDYPLYESAFDKVIQTEPTKKIILESLYWVLPQFGTNFYYSLSFIAKSFAQTHNLGNYSIIQISVWTIFLWIVLYFAIRDRELG
jgi:ABC-type transport system involved in multi-copper enzyme maturation permease subunit